MSSPWKIKKQAGAVSQKRTLPTTGESSGISPAEFHIHTMFKPPLTHSHSSAFHSSTQRSIWKKRQEIPLYTHIKTPLFLSLLPQFSSSWAPSSTLLLLGPPPQLPSSWASLLSSLPLCSQRALRDFSTGAPRSSAKFFLKGASCLPLESSVEASTC